MSEQQPPDPQQPEPAGPATENHDDRTDSLDVAALRREAAKYRRERNELRTENGTLRDRLGGYERQDAERLVAGVLGQPADLWLVASLDAMRADDGALDPEKVMAEAQRALAERPHWGKPVRPDLHAGARENPPDEPPSFGQTFKRALRGS